MLKVLKIIVPPGLGDFSWLYSKLVGLNIKLEVTISAGGFPRLVPLCDILPNVSTSGNSLGMSFPQLRAKAVPSTIGVAQLLKLGENGPVHLEINTQLEHGLYARDWMPELPMNYHYPMAIPQVDIQRATALVPKMPFVAVFAAALSTAQTWKGWMPEDWCRFFQLFMGEFGPMNFVIVGAAWDVPMADGIEKLCNAANVPVTNLVNTTNVGEVVHVISLSTYFVSFPSGLGVLANVVDTPATMFYPVNLQQMIGKWADPETIADLSFYESVFLSPQAYVEWLRDGYHMRDHL